MAEESENKGVQDFVWGQEDYVWGQEDRILDKISVLFYLLFGSALGLVDHFLVFFILAYMVF